MHELALALEICRMAAERLDPAQHRRLVAVGVEVGDDGGIEPDNLAFCLEALLSQPPFGQAKPVLTRVAGDTLRLEYLEVDDDDPDD
ncbi:MAG: hydrogenase/urease maturation nickel metallochaperone HypA [Gemmatimonadota bacterium]